MEKDENHSEPLLNTYRDNAAQQHHRHSLMKKTQLSFLGHVRVIIIAQTIFNISLFLLGSHLLSRSAGPVNPLFPQLLYSPAQDVLEYKVMKYRGGFGSDKSVFQGPPSPELDAAWLELEMYGISSIPRYQAAQMPFKTRPIPGEKGHYIVQLDVFHQLHCLNAVRRAHHRDYYGSEYGPDAEEKLSIHLEHCIEGLRQSLMCSADISPIIWLWAEDIHEALPAGSIVHTCRDFDKVLQWGKEHVINDTLWDGTVFVKDDL